MPDWFFRRLFRWKTCFLQAIKQFICSPVGRWASEDALSCSIRFEEMCVAHIKRYVDALSA